METNNMNIRERFEEIWPVPEGVYWNNGLGEYIPLTSSRTNLAVEWDARLDTFTRCQETMGPVLSLVDELVAELESCYSELRVRDPRDIIHYAKQIMGQKK